jgi:anti-sigma factor (TIGR02949 family)
MSNPQKVEVKKQHCENHQKCMEMIQAVLDGSASPDEIEHFKSHIDECLPCIEGYQLEKSIKEGLKNKIERKCCPQQTVDLLKVKIGISLFVLGFVAVELKLIQLFFQS